MAKVADFMKTKVLKNTTVYMLAGLLPSLVSLVMLPVYTRFMDRSQYGILAMVMAFSSFLVPFMGLQLMESVRRFYFDFDRKEGARHFSTILYSVFLINGLLLLLIHLNGERIAGVAFSKANVSYKPYVVLAIITAFFTSTGNLCRLLLQVQERGLPILWIAAVRTVVNLGVGIYCIVYRGMGAHGVLLAAAWSATISAGLLLIYVRSYITLRFSLRMLINSLLYSLPMIPHALGSIVFLYSDKLILGYYLPLAAVGIYELANRFSMVFNQAIVSFDKAITPTFMWHSIRSKSEAVDAFEIIITRWAVIVSTAYLALALFSEEVVMLLVPERFHDAYVFIPILAGAYVFRGLYLFAVKPILFEKRTRLIPLITFTAGAVNVAGNILLIPRLGVIAAALTTLLSLGLSFVLTLAFAQKLYPLKYNTQKLIRIFGLMLILFLSTVILRTEYVWANVGIKLLAFASFVGVQAKWNYGDTVGEGLALLLSLMAKIRARISKI